ncbi:MAG: class I SAM-dependent methyltransferase [Paludibacter sp.]|nr:class I SAM-dependent methyltransferase [Paludibacter sp.]
MDKEKIVAVYRRRASSYNSDVKFFNLIGWRVNFYRKIAIKALNLSKGDTVVDLCCGTGLNFSDLFNAVGPEGKIIGVDLSADMLKVAEKQVREQGWNNFTLIHKDAAKYRFPDEINSIVTSYAITLIPEFDTIISRGANSLTEGGRFVILDFKKPKSWPDWLAKLMLSLCSSNPMAERMN